MFTAVRTKLFPETVATAGMEEMTHMNPDCLYKIVTYNSFIKYLVQRNVTINDWFI